MSLLSTTGATTSRGTKLPRSSHRIFLHVAGGLVGLAAFCILPIVYIETTDLYHAPPLAPSVLARADETDSAAAAADNNSDKNIQSKKQQQVISVHQVVQAGQQNLRQVAGQKEDNTKNKKDDRRVVVANKNTQVIKSLKDITIWDDPATESLKPLGRGISGRPMEQTPALQGAKRAHVECDVNVDSLAYWNDPTGKYDQNFVNPFAVSPEKEKFITFSPDAGGWNNIRMSMEIIFVLAAVTGRTLVLPPKEPLYLLHNDKSSRHRGFADFFPIHTAQFQSRVKVITMQDFLTQQEGKSIHLPTDEKERAAILAAADHCDHFQSSTSWCGPLHDFLRSPEAGTNPKLAAHDHCIVFDETKFQDKDKELDPDTQDVVTSMCGVQRKTVFWHRDMNEPDILHFPADERDYRLLTHFYAMIHFTNPAFDHHFKRFVRDFLHYHDAIYCAAGKIVKALQQEGIARGFPVDPITGAGGYSALHVRRGDLQYKKVKIPAEEWYENTKELWQPNEILYIATDEKDKTFFAPIAQHYSLRFLGDYWDLAGLSELDPNYMGMIDTIIASRGRVFAGTFFSTFTGYINRLRGYHGMSMMDSWYGWLPRKDLLHKWNVIAEFAYAYEWPDGWQGIDANTWPSRDVF